ncbi:MAG: carboxylating nicotinate-nucleotide diphosphorylase [Puniceicoccales bacterium]|jgi:nicotinate-nucleotide pyrophosphorylase (carboxylating)|nr:carboxylating nicotinate-nucleotide diphosphorylase [Puniceicoccales bacterium]
MKSDAFHDHLFRRLRWEEISHAYLAHLADSARDEDLSGLGLASAPLRSGDPSTAYSTIAGGVSGRCVRAKIVARHDCILCGVNMLQIILDSFAAADRAFFRIIDPLPDGTAVSRNDTIATLQCPAPLLLRAERTLLNFLQKLTGIATTTAAYAAKLADTPARLLDTRKTTPGWRILEKYAVATGGGWNHRLGLFDRIMLKDNHLAANDASGNGHHERKNLVDLVRHVRDERSRLCPDLVVECEVDSIAQIQPVLDAGADVILLDNFPLDTLALALAQIGSHAWTEVSGGVTFENIRAIALLHPDFISTGALTHHAPWADISLDWETT